MGSIESLLVTTMDSLAPDFIYCREFWTPQITTKWNSMPCVTYLYVHVLYMSVAMSITLSVVHVYV